MRGGVQPASLGDIDTGEHTMAVRGKGGHERLLPISDQTWAAMAAYRLETPGGDGPLIRSRSNPHDGIKPGYVSTMVSNFMREAGVKAHGKDGRSAHSFRHTFATDALRHGAHPPGPAGGRWGTSRCPPRSDTSHSRSKGYGTPWVGAATGVPSSSTRGRPQRDGRTHHNPAGPHRRPAMTSGERTGWRDQDISRRHRRHRTTVR